MEQANRLKRLPPYLFTVIDDLKREARLSGLDIIDLAMGNPDMSPAPHIINELSEAIKIPENHKYSKSDGKVEQSFNNAIAEWYYERFKVELNPKTEVLPLIGSKEGVAHLATAFLNPDDIALVPSPAYPVHFNGVILAGGILYNLPLTKENDYIPDLNNIQKDVLKRAKMLFLSYPHNPTGAIIRKGFFEEVIKWSKGKEIMIIHDAAYSDIVFDGYKAPSFMQTKGAKEIGIEFHTLSKSYNMAGWRSGFVVGNEKILSVLRKTKSYIDFSLFKGIQQASAKALTGPQDCVTQTVKEYYERISLFIAGLNEMGWNVPMPKATFYIWAHIPLKFNALSSLEFSALLLRETGVATAPGTGFGEYGEGYIRFALVDDKQRLKEAIERIKKFLK